MPTSLKPLLISIISILAPTFCWSQLEQFIPRSSGGEYIEHAYYTLEYNEKHEQASYVIYELKSDREYGTVSRTDNFRNDPNVSTGSAGKKDYKGSGYDRGHLAPAADMSFNDTAMSESFFMSNMSPQQPSFNRGIWKQAEELVRNWMSTYEHMVVITGPIFINTTETIGPNEVTVPSAFYKIIYHYNDSTQTHQVIGFIIPNKKGEYDLNTYIVSIDEIEIQTGIDFFYKFPEEEQEVFEAKIDLSSWEFD